MGMYFSQELIYGYKTTYAKFQELVETEDSEAYDNAMAYDNEDGWGWIVAGEGDDYAIYGKLILSGEDNGNDSVFAAESGAVEIPFLNDDNAQEVRFKIYETFSNILEEEIKYYITGNWG